MSKRVPSGRRLPRWLFLRCLGLVYLVAFWSLFVQLDGLIGPSGIAPADLTMARLEGLKSTLVDFHWWQVPTLSWFLGADISTLNIFCLAGMSLALGLCMGVWPRVVLMGLWCLYLSFFSLSSPFLNFQWDILLLEMTVLAVLYAPSGILPRLKDEREPSALAVWLLRILLFKLILSSGIVKLMSGDASWNNLSALDYHFWTQPIPHPLSWYIHHIGGSFRQGGVLLNHFIELFVPWLIIFNPKGIRLGAWFLLSGVVLYMGLGELSLIHVFVVGLLSAILGGRIQADGADSSPARIPAALLVIALMLSVASSGNYGFFNLLTIALTMTCLDDAFVFRFVPNQFLSRLPNREFRFRPERRYWRVLVASCGFVLIPLNGFQLLDFIDKETKQAMAARVIDERADLMDSMVTSLGEARQTVQKVTHPFALVNGYGLFRTMTKARPELLIEGSYDGQNWLRYGFQYKPSQDTDPLVFAGLHMPRLDWQLWFAALYPRCSNRWFFGFLESLLEGSPDTLGLLGENPFKNGPPKFIRVNRAGAEFTSPKQREKTGKVWRFGSISAYCPTLSKRRFKTIKTGRKRERHPAE